MKSCGAVTIQMKLLKMPIFSHGTISFLTFYKKKFGNFVEIGLWPLLAVKVLIWLAGLALPRQD